MIMTAAAFLNANPKPDWPVIRQALAGNLCRCGKHVRILNSGGQAVAANFVTGIRRAA